MAVKWSSTFYDQHGQVSRRTSGRYTIAEALLFFWDQYLLYADKTTGKGLKVVKVSAEMLEIKITIGVYSEAVTLTWKSGIRSVLLSSVGQFVLHSTEHPPEVVAFFKKLHS